MEFGFKRSYCNAQEQKLVRNNGLSSEASIATDDATEPWPAFFVGEYFKKMEM